MLSSYSLPSRSRGALHESLVPGRNAPRGTFLDFLSVDEVENVMRFMSTKPFHRFWVSFIEISDLFPLFRVGGSLTKFCLEHFNAFTLCQDAERGSGIMTENGNVFIRTFQDYSSLMDIAGPRFSNASFIDISRHVNFRVVTPARPSMTNVKVLRLWNVNNHALFKLLLSSCGNTLESLSAVVMTNDNVDAMVEHCGGLRSLEIFREDGPHCILVLTGLWIAVGNTLQTLCMKDGYCSIEQDFRCIQTHCRNLRSIEIDETNQYIALSMLCASLGDQLEHVAFTSMPLSRCHLIVQACPNVLWAARYWANPVLVAILPTIGAGLKELVIFCTPESCGGGVVTTMNYCPNLKKLRVTCMSTLNSLCGIVSTLFSNPMPQLEVLELRRVSFNYADALYAIARISGQLREFSFSCLSSFPCYGVRPPKEAFASLVRANGFLEHVTIDLHEDYTHDIVTCSSAVLDLIEVFSNCPVLRELTILQNGKTSPIEFSVEAVKTLVPFRVKKTYFCVGDQDIYC